MRNRLITCLMILATIPVMSGCTTLVLAGGGVLAADAIVEETEGGDGLF